MSKTQKHWLLWGIVALLVAYLLLNTGVIGPKEWAQARERQVWVDTSPRGLSLCTRYPNGVYAGWIQGYSNYGPWPEHALHYELGPWSGSFCSNHRHIWNIDWGTIDHRQGFAWYWDWTRLGGSSKSDTYAYRRWNGKFHAGFPFPLDRTDYPFISVTLGVDQYMDFNKGCGC